jgi:hypothetical protein
VKTRSRLLPLSAHGTFAVQAYLREPAPLGRRRGSAFLVAGTHGGRPLGTTAAERVTVLLSVVAMGHLSWHDLRHAWATDFARGVLMNVREGGLPTAPDEQAMLALLSASLRELGGWSETSKEPLYYARAAIREAAMGMLARVQEARARRAAAAWKSRVAQSVPDPNAWMMPEEDGLPW